MRLQDQRNALDRGGIGALASFRESLLEQNLWICEQLDALAGRAFTAKVINEALAIRGLGEHASERELAYTARTGEEQRVGHSRRAQGAAKRGYDACVA
jgi:hypothetical protein